MCRDQKQAFSNTTLGRNTVAARVCSLPTKSNQWKRENTSLLHCEGGHDLPRTAVSLHPCSGLQFVLRGNLWDLNQCMAEPQETCLKKCVNMRMNWHGLGQRDGTDDRWSTCDVRVRFRMLKLTRAGDLRVYYLQEILGGMALKNDHVIMAVPLKVNVTRGKVFNHCQFQSFLEEILSMELCPITPSCDTRLKVK